MSIPISNIGMKSDGVYVMYGEKNSFESQLKSCIPNFIIIKCIYYSSGLVASKACKMLPRFVEDLIWFEASYGYVLGSAKRFAQLVEIQELLNDI